MKKSNVPFPQLRRFFTESSARERFILINFLSAFGLAVALLILFGPGAVAVKKNFEGIAPGIISDRDISSGKDVVYIDDEATRLRVDAEERLVLPVFQLDNGISTRISAQYRDFSEAFREIMEQDIAQNTAILMIQSKFPGKFSYEILSSLATSSLKSQILVYAEDILSALLIRGIISLPTEGLSRYNQDYYELRRLVGDKTEYEQISLDSMTTKANLQDAIAEEIAQKHLARPLAATVQGIVNAFIAENAFFDEALSLSRLRKAVAKIEPVTRAVGKSEVIVRKGELVTEDMYARLEAIRKAMSRSDIGLSLRGLGLLLTGTLLGFFLIVRNETLKATGGTSSVLMGIYGALVFHVIVLLASRVTEGTPAIYGTYFIPISLFSGIAAALAGQGFAFSFSVILAVLTASASNLNPYYLIYVLLAGIFASFTITTAKTRIDLVRAALLQSLLQFGIGLVLLIQQDLRIGELLATSGYMGLNGFISGALLLAILPVLEQSFNLPTRFRLLELSDVNAAPLKELLTQAPGTYAHSMNVAHLAEAAAEDIGANSLLARVGAYYHDIGKIEQPEYFVENQRGSNKHDDINPRLSATVIRSHVKIGTERARELKLPREVVEIVAQHHGNSVIAWFYDKAKHNGDAVRKEDFSYPGSPPTSKEAGIVMLADAVEASTRTLKKPTIPRLDAHVRQLILAKISDGQLDGCNLTMSELERIRHSFVRIMAGQFHSRIEYPNQRDAEE